MTRRRLPRNDATVLDAAVLLDGEIAYDTTNNELRIGDGVTAGGRAVSNADDLAASDGAGQVGFLQAGTGAVARTAQAKMRETVSVKDFDAVGDGAADDAVALQAAINTGRPLDFGDGIYRIATPISRTATADLTWFGDGAKIVYDGLHTEAAVSVTTSAKINMSISGLTFDGGKKCNMPLKIRSTGAMTNACTLTFNNTSATRSLKSASFGSAIGIYVLGSFEVVEFNGGIVSDCEMPTGSGTPSVSGVAGINVSLDGSTKWCRRLIINGTKVEKIYSSDLTYVHDQDGIGYFVPDDASDAGKVDSLLVVGGGASFTNCYGRSIKTQCRDTIVTDSKFLRTEGYNGGVGDVEIDAQTGSLFTDKNTHDYKNGFGPSACVRSLSGSAYGESGLSARDATVYVDSATTLERFAQTFPNTGYTSTAIIEGVRVFGKVKEFAALIFNGNKNYARVANCWLNEIVNGPTSEKALVYIRAGGVGSPYDALIEIEGNRYYGTDSPSVARSQISGAEMTATISARINPGFSNAVTDAINPSGLHTKQTFAVNGLTGGSKSDVKFSERFLEVTVAAGATATIPVRKSSGAARLSILEGTAGNGINYIEFWSTNNVNDAVKIGPNFTMGDTTEPVSGVFRVWSTSTNQVSLKNTDSASYTFSIKIRERG